MVLVMARIVEEMVVELMRTAKGYRRDGSGVGDRGSGRDSSSAGRSDGGGKRLLARL